MSHEAAIADRPEVILIAGPTASGKSALALRLAQHCDGIIINADSMQVYRDLRIITARPTPADERQAPHALFGHVDGATAYSVSQWLADAARAVAQARADGRMPIVVGGTGLYFKALTEGLSDIPAVPHDLRAEFRAWAAGRAPRELHDELSRRDPLTASRLRPSDPQRIIRALEVQAATGESLTAFQATRAPAPLAGCPCLSVRLAVDRTELRAHIDRRFDQMVEDDAVREVATLAERRLDPSLPIMRALGVPPILRHLAGELSLPAAVAEAKAATRRYIKRQETFARHQLPQFAALEVETAESVLLAKLQSA